MKLVQQIRRLLGIVIAMVLAVVSGIGTIVLLDEILPHGKTWQLLTMCVAAIGVASVVGLRFLRTVGPSRSETPLAEP